MGLLVGVRLVHTLYVTEGAPQLLHDFHVFERRLERFGGDLEGFHRGVTGSLGRASCLLTSDSSRFRGFPQALPLCTE